MDKKQLIRQYCRQFKMGAIAAAIDQLVADAQTNSLGYLDFTEKLLATEAAHREQNDVIKRLKAAKLPRSNDLGSYDHTVENGLSKTRLNQLRELNWLDQVYNIMLMGPSGTGKTYLAAGLCADAVKKGYKAYFRTMEELINLLKMKDFTRTAMADYKRLSKASLIVIDDIMLFPVEKNQAVAFLTLSTACMKKHPSSSPPIKNQPIGSIYSRMKCWQQLYWTEYYTNAKS